MQSLLIIGCGDIGLRIVRQVRQHERRSGLPALEVFGLIRDRSQSRTLTEAGCTPLMRDLSGSDSAGKFPSKGASLIYLAPPPRNGAEDTNVRQLVASMNTDNLPARVVLVSTTAVYGNCEGRWITEQEPANPQTDRGKRRLDAEQQMQAWCDANNVPWVILRVGGIYGPGRWPLERLRKGLPILSEHDSPYTNRIHQDDLASICLAAARSELREGIFNVADGQPGTMSGYFKAVASAFDIPLPPEVSMEEAQQVMTAGMLSYLVESRRIDNHKLMNELGIQLRYPDLIAGLAAVRGSSTDT